MKKISLIKILITDIDECVGMIKFWHKNDVTPNIILHIYIWNNISLSIIFSYEIFFNFTSHYYLLFISFTQVILMWVIQMLNLRTLPDYAIYAGEQLLIHNKISICILNLIKVWFVSLLNIWPHMVYLLTICIIRSTVISPVVSYEIYMIIVTFQILMSVRVLRVSMVVLVLTL